MKSYYNSIDTLRKRFNLIKEAEDDKKEDKKDDDKKESSDNNSGVVKQEIPQVATTKTLDFENPEDSGKNPNKEEENKKEGYFFNTILFFTNEREEDKNKTLKNLNDAIKGKDVEIKTFVAKEINYKAKDNVINFNDNKTSYKIDKQSNVDTIVISRLGVQDSEECMELIKELQEWGFFVINPVQSAKKASNKYTSAVLMERYKIPQPKFTLLSINDIKDGMDSLKKKLKVIYSDVGEDNKEDNKKEYVVKILDGHGGTGVFMTTGKHILAILQAMFAVDNEIELLLQKKEEADGGDIRVHVLTMRTEQHILAAMKRVKISGDFRSNVSLGASAEKVKLTKEQEEIALKVAMISGMPWCAVDIMPLVKGSNEELGDNAVLEYNASPGTDGISEVIEENFMKILLDNINDINQLVLSPKSIGYIEDVKLFLDKDSDEFIEIESKFDTGNGAKASTLGCDRVTVEDDNVSITVNGKDYTFKKHGQSNAIVGQVTEERPTIIVPCIQIGTRKLLDVEFAVVDNRNKKQKVLINRDVMSKMAYQINASKSHLLKPQI